MSNFAAAVISDENLEVQSGTPDPVPWWSFTKTVLATAALRLVDLGAVRLTDAVEGRPFTLKHLLRHESGLGDYGSLAEYHEDVAAGRIPWPIPRLLAAVHADRLLYEPGHGWLYSNVGYLEVAQLIERVSELPLGAALSALVFEPCSLTTARLARSPSELDGVQMGAARAYHPGWVYHGLVVGSATDAARLLHALMKGSLLEPATLDAMLEGRPLPEYRSEKHPDAAYGLGLMLSASEPMAHPIGHSGGGPGSEIAVYARGGRTAAVWTGHPSVIDADEEALRLLS